MNGIRAFSACLDAIASGSDDIIERPLDLRELVGEEVATVEPWCGGIRFRFGSGMTFVAPRGVLLDGVGNPVIEP